MGSACTSPKPVIHVPHWLQNDKKKSTGADDDKDKDYRKSDADDPGIVMRPAPNSDSLQMELLKLSKTDIEKLMQNFEFLKNNRMEMGKDIKEAFKRKLPEASKIMQKHDHHTDDNWQKIPIGMLLSHTMVLLIFSFIFINRSGFAERSRAMFTKN